MCGSIDASDVFVLCLTVVLDQVDEFFFWAVSFHMVEVDHWGKTKAL